MYTATASPYLGRSDRRARTADATLNWNVSLRKRDTAEASPYLGRSDRRARTADAPLNHNSNIRRTPVLWAKSE